MGIFSRKKTTPEKVDKKEKKAVEPAKDSSVKKDKQSMKDLYGDDKKVVKKEGKESKGKEKGSSKQEKNAYRILLKPLITEKAANLGVENKYVFAVSLDANKIEIANAISEVYGIKPVSVNVIKMKGKKVRSGRIMGKRKDWKKAIVALPQGKTINIYEGV